MKRLSLVLALVAVLALAGTAAAGPNVTISGSATLTFTGDSDKLSPNIGSPTFDISNSVTISGNGFTLSGTLNDAPLANSISGWKLTLNPSIFQVTLGNNVAFGAITDLLPLMTGAADNAGGVNRLRLVAPVGQFKVTYDKAMTSPTASEFVFIDLPKGAVLPADVRFAVANLAKQTLVGSAVFGLPGNVSVEAAAGMTSGVANSLSYGAEVTIPLSASLQAYVVGKVYGPGFDNIAAEELGKYKTLFRLTYTQPQYKVMGYFWQRYWNSGNNAGTLDKKEHYVTLSLVQKNGDNLDWTTADDGNGYRNLKGVGVWAKYVIANPASLPVAVGAPVIPGKAAVRVDVDNLLVKDDPATANVVEAPKFTGKLWVQVSPKLSSVTTAEYKPGQGNGLLTLKDDLAYSITSNASFTLTLEKATLGSGADAHDGIKYSGTLKVTF